MLSDFISTVQFCRPVLLVIRAMKKINETENNCLCDLTHHQIRKILLSCKNLPSVRMPIAQDRKADPKFIH